MQASFNGEDFAQLPIDADRQGRPIAQIIIFVVRLFLLLLGNKLRLDLLAIVIAEGSYLIQTFINGPQDRRRLGPFFLKKGKERLESIGKIPSKTIRIE